jgi:glycosyltransferase involved in cell wall biosynthesis
MWLIKGLGAGGAETLLADSVPFLDRQTFNYEIAYLLPWKRDLVPAFEKGGVPVHCLNSKSRFDPGVIFRVRRLLKERKVTLLHAHLPSTGIMGRLAARTSGVRAVVYTEHNMLGVYHPFIRLMNRLTYRLDDATTAVSAEVAGSTTKWPFFRPKRLSVIDNGIALASADFEERARGRPLLTALGVPKDNLVIGNIAHLRPAKGHNYLLEAVRDVVKVMPGVTCVVVGREKTPGVQAGLEEYARTLGIEKHVMFTGFREDARAIAAETDVFVLSSLFEGLPIALLEAMALGKASVVTAVGGVPEVVTDGLEGFVVLSKDPTALADRIVKVLGDSALRQRMGVAARAKVIEKYSTKRMVRDIEQVYAGVLARKNVEISPRRAELAPVVAPAQPKANQAK